MKSYVIYKHPELEIQVVKIGISWPAGIFSIFWLIVKRLWLYTFIWVLATIACEYIESNIANVGGGISLLLILVAVILNIALAVTPAVQGNSWLGTQLEKAGYKESGIISAASLKDAKELAISQDNLENNSHVAA